MKNIWTICKKEIKTYFTSPIAYVAILIFLVLVGFFFYSLIWWFNSYTMQMARYDNLQQLNINQMVYSPLFHNMSIILLLMIPVLTMRLFAEEKKKLDVKIKNTKKEIQRLEDEVSSATLYTKQELDAKIEMFKKNWLKATTPKEQNDLLKTIVKRIFYDRQGDNVVLEIEYL